MRGYRHSLPKCGIECLGRIQLGGPKNMSQVDRHWSLGVFGPAQNPSKNHYHRRTGGDDDARAAALMIDKTSGVYGITMPVSLWNGCPTPRLSDLGHGSSAPSSRAAIGLFVLLMKTLFRVVPDPTQRARTDGLPLLSGDVELLRGERAGSVSAFRFLFCVHTELRNRDLSAELEHVLREHRQSSRDAAASATPQTIGPAAAALPAATVKRRPASAAPSSLRRQAARGSPQDDALTGCSRWIDCRDRLMRVAGVHFGQNLVSQQWRIAMYGLGDPPNPLNFHSLFGIRRWIQNPMPGACNIAAVYLTLANYAETAPSAPASRHTASEGYVYRAPPVAGAVWEIRSSEMSLDGLLHARLPDFDHTRARARGNWMGALESYVASHTPAVATGGGRQSSATTARSAEDAFLEAFGFATEGDRADISLAEMGRHNAGELLAIEREEAGGGGGGGAAARFERFCQARAQWQEGALERFCRRVWTPRSPILSEAQRALVEFGLRQNPAGGLTRLRVARTTANLSLVDDWLLRFVISTDEAFRVASGGHLPILVAYLSALNAFDPDRKNKLHLLLSGEHAQSKSFTLHTLASMLVPGVLQDVTYATSGSMTGATTGSGSSDGSVYVFHEAPYKMLGVSGASGPGRGGALSEAEARCKQQLTSGEVTVLELGYEDGKRVRKKQVHRVNAVYMCATNASVDRIAPPMLSRFFEVHTGGPQASGRMEVIEKICQDSSAQQREWKDAFVASLRWMQHVTALIFMLLEAHVLSPIDLSLTNQCLPLILQTAASRGLAYASDVRHVERARCLVRLLVVVRAALRWGRRGTAGDEPAAAAAGSSVDFKHILQVQQDLSDSADATILPTAIGLLRDAWQPPALNCVADILHRMFTRMFPLPIMAARRRKPGAPTVHDTWSSYVERPPAGGRGDHDRQHPDDYRQSSDGADDERAATIFGGADERSAGDEDTEDSQPGNGSREPQRSEPSARDTRRRLGARRRRLTLERLEPFLSSDDAFMLESPQVVPPVRQRSGATRSSANDGTDKMRRALAEVLATQQRTDRTQYGVDPISAALKALEQSEVDVVDADGETHRGIKVLRYTPQTGCFSLAVSYLLDRDRDPLKESASAVLQRYVSSARADALWPTSSADTFSSVSIIKSTSNMVSERIPGRSSAAQPAAWLSFRERVVGTVSACGGDGGGHDGVARGSTCLGQDQLYRRFQTARGIRHEERAETEDSLLDTESVALDERHLGCFPKPTNDATAAVRRPAKRQRTDSAALRPARCLK